MKTTAFLLLISLFPLLGLQAQEADTTRYNRKIGITFQNLDHFGLIYKTKLDQRYLRIEALNLKNVISQSVSPNERSSPQNVYKINLGFNIGLEKYHPLVERFGIINGYSFLSGIRFDRNKVSGEITSKHFNTNIGVGYIMGVNYTISKAFEITAEIRPALRYYFDHKKNFQDNRTNKHYTHSFMFNFSDDVRLSILYNF
ncbi:MAG: hypothetical protein V5A47_13460 [Bacteroidales bacterium]|nr:hypothetical protein [Bacteroidales bacterium]MBS3776434.1 hypothetical protein [Bacteroidales bacterium]